MKPIFAALAAGLILAGGIALAQSDTTEPGSGAGEGMGSGTGVGAGMEGSGHVDHERHHGDREGGHHDRGHRHHGDHGDHGGGGHHGHRHGGHGGIWKAGGAGFEMHLPGTGALRVNCGDTPADACFAAAQPLIDAIAGGTGE